MKYFFQKKLNYLIITFLLVVHLFIISKIKFTAWPEMLTYPWLISKGFKYYGDIIQPYLPLLSYMLLGFYKIIGFSVLTLKIITLIFILISDLFIYLIAQKLHNTKNTFITLGLYIVLQIFFEGNGLWFELASLPFVLCAYYCLINWQSKSHNKWLIFSGLNIGFAALIKQNNFLYLIPYLICIFNFKRVFHKKNIFHILSLIVPSLIPLLILVIIYSTTDQFKDFLYWGLYHPLFVHTRSQGFLLFPTIRQTLIILFIISPMIFIYKNNNRLLIWLFISLFFAFPRFGYFHLQHFVAFFSLILPYLFIKFSNIKITFFVCYLVVLLILFCKFISRDYGQPTRFFDPQILSIRNILESKIGNNEPIFFYNTSSEYFVGTKLIPLKPWADTFPWYLEVPGLQTKIIENLEVNKTQWVVFNKFKNEEEFVPGSYRPKLIDAYVNNNYQINEQINSDIFLLKRKE